MVCQWDHGVVCVGITTMGEKGGVSSGSNAGVTGGSKAGFMGGSKAGFTGGSRAGVTGAQVTKLKEKATLSLRKEAAAKAVLQAAQAAARELRLLTKEERAAIERPLLFPEQVAAEEAARKAAEEKVCSLFHPLSCGLIWDRRRVGLSVPSPNECFLPFHNGASPPLPSPCLFQLCRSTIVFHLSSCSLLFSFLPFFVVFTFFIQFWSAGRPYTISCGHPCCGLGYGHSYCRSRCRGRPSGGRTVTGWREGRSEGGPCLRVVNSFGIL